MYITPAGDTRRKIDKTTGLQLPIANQIWLLLFIIASLPARILNVSLY